MKVPSTPPSELKGLFGLSDRGIAWRRLLLVWCALTINALINRVIWPLVNGIIEGDLAAVDLTQPFSFWLLVQSTLLCAVLVGLIVVALGVTRQRWFVAALVGIGYALLYSPLRGLTLRAHFSSELSDDPELRSQVLEQFSLFDPLLLVSLGAFGFLFVLGIGVVQWIRPIWFGLLAGLLGVQVVNTFLAYALYPIELTLKRGLQDAIMSSIWAISLASLWALALALTADERPVESDGAVPEASAGADSIPEGPRGIGGWLVLPAIGLVLGPIFFVAGIGFMLGVVPEVFDSEFGGLLVAELLFDALIVLYALYVATRFFGKKKGVPGLMITLIVLGLGKTMVFLLIELGAGAEVFAVESVKQLVKNAISAAIWIPYFRVSERARNTFVN